MQRYLALDVMRGITIALMILVNSPGSWSHIYPPLMHAKWHGMTPTDLIFPFFLFIVGSAMYFAFSKQNFQLNSGVAQKIIKRSALIFIIGFLLNIFPFTSAPEDWRIMGVLQRIALTYGVAAFAVLLLNRWQLLVFCIAILVFYSFTLINYSDTPYLLFDNLVRTIDIAAFGQTHIYQGLGTAFDPEGLYSSLPAIINLLFGFELTRWLVAEANKKAAVIKLMGIAFILIICGFVLDFYVPINKALWTASYVIVTSGFATLLLAGLIAALDLGQQQKLFQPFLIYGTNPLFIYVISWVLVTTCELLVIGDKTVQQHAFLALSQMIAPKMASLIYALAYVVLFWWFSKWLYQRNIFIKL